MNKDRKPQPRLLVVGAGDVALRALPWLTTRFRVYALCRNADSAARWRAAGAVPIVADLDQRATLRRLAGVAQYVLHTAPPDQTHRGDPRSQRLLAALGVARIIPRSLVYISTTGVYGDCAGARVSESRPRLAASARAQRRVAAEDLLRDWLRRGCRQRHGQQGHGPRGRPALSILRAPGIYASDRLPLQRLQSGTPALRAEDDGYTSHIHADDLARAAALALFRVRGGRALNVCDDSSLRMGEWFCAVAASFGLAEPPRISRVEAERTLPESLLSFMRESRRLNNRRLKQELRLRLAYPTVAEGLAAARQSQGVFPVGTDADRRGREQQGDGSQIGQDTGPQEQQPGQH